MSNRRPKKNYNRKLFTDKEVKQINQALPFIASKSIKTSKLSELFDARNISSIKAHLNKIKKYDSNYKIFYNNNNMFFKKAVFEFLSNEYIKNNYCNKNELNNIENVTVNQDNSDPKSCVIINPYLFNSLSTNLSDNDIKNNIKLSLNENKIYNNLTHFLFSDYINNKVKDLD